MFTSFIQTFRCEGLAWKGWGRGLSEGQRSVLSQCSSEFPADAGNEITGVCIFTSPCRRGGDICTYIADSLHIQLMQRCKVAILQLKTNKCIHIYLFTKIKKNKAFKLYINYNQEITM